jgi:hypothetical protein
MRKIIQQIHHAADAGGDFPQFANLSEIFDEQANGQTALHLELAV